MKQEKLKNEIKICKIVQKSEDVFELFFEQIEMNDVKQTKINMTGDVLAQLGILKPQVITQAMYAQLLVAKDFQVVYTQALNYLSYRKRSVEEMRRFLRTKTMASVDLIQTVIDKLLAQKYLDDHDFIVSYIKTAQKTTLHGPIRLGRALEELGCEHNAIELYLHELFPLHLQENQLHKLFAKMMKKKYASQNVMFDKYNQKAIALGYNYDVINKVKAVHITDHIAIDEAKIQKMLLKTYRRLNKKGSSDFQINQGLRACLLTKGITNERITEYLIGFYEELGKIEET